MASGLTPTYLIPYPLSTDPVDVHGDVRDLAVRVEDILELKSGLADNNIFTGSNVFSSNSSNTPLTVKQTGNGNAFVVEDSASPDLTPFLINNLGNVGIGKNAPLEKLDITGNANIDGVLLGGPDARSNYLSAGAITKTVSFKSYVTATNTATITTTSSHGFFPGLMVDIDLTPADVTFDGQVEVLTVTSDTFTFLAPSSFPTNITSTASTGSASYAGGYTNPVAVFGTDANDYAQIAFKNNSDSPNASTDFIVYADNGNDYNGWIDMGITSSAFDDPSFTITGPNDGYIFMSAPYGTTGAGNLVLATDSTGTENKIIFAAGGLSTDNTQMEITPDVNVHIEIPTPSTSPSTGALTIVGGVGVQGDLYMAGDLDVSSGGIIARDELFVGEDAVSQSQTIGTNVKTASFKARSGTVATLTTTVAHGYQPFQFVDVALSPADAVFDGTDIEILTVPTPTTFTYTVASGTTSSTATAGTISAVTGWTNPVAIFTADADDYAQIVFQNLNNGEDASTDVIVYSDNGNDYSGWMDMGITSSTFADPEFSITGPNDGYIFMRAPYGTTGAGNLVLATSEYGTENKIIFAAGGLDSDSTQMEITPGVNVHVEIATPSTSPTTGAFTVVGGVGILGDMNVQGNVNIAGTITFGGGGTTVVTDNLAVSDPAIFIGTGNASTSTDLSFVGEYPVSISTITKSIDQKQYSIATETATFRTTAAHTYLAGDIVEITDVQTEFDSTFQVVDVPTSTTFTIKVLGIAADIPPTAVSPTGTATVSLRRRFYGISRDGADGIVKFFEGVTTKPTNNVVYTDPTFAFASLKAGALELVTALPVLSGGTGATTAQNARNNLLPAQSGNNGEFLTTDGTNVSWATVDALPSQSGNTGKYLTTDGSVASWAIVDLLPSQTGNTGKYLTTNGSTTSWAFVAGGSAQSTEPTSPVEGQIWLDTDGSTNPVSVDLIRWTQTVSTTTTTFTGNGDGAFALSYSPGTEQVYLNGVMLIRGSDYSAISGTSIVLVQAAVAGDILQVITLPAANLSNAVNLTLFTTKGDIAAAASAGVVNRLGVGANGTILVADSTQTLGMAWGNTLQAATSSTVPLVVRGAASQTADVFEALNSAGAELFAIRANGRLKTVNLSTEVDSSTLLMSANATNNSSGTSIVQWGKDVATWGGDIHYIADSRGVNGSHVFWNYDGTSFLERARIDKTGNMGIGGISTGSKLQVFGSFSATTKSFDIEHPTKEGMRLRYGSLEGPENGVYVRGTTSENIIELPDYWTGLVHADSITVNLTAVGKSQNIYVEKIEDNKVYIGGELEKAFFTVYGERKDVDKLTVEY